MLSTIFGLLKSTLRVRLNLEKKDPKLTNVFNYQRLDERLYTSGQPTPAEFKLIKDKGCAMVVNLSPQRSPNAVENEKDIVEALGMKYLRLPLDFGNPGEEEYARFAAQLDAVHDGGVWVHCAANLMVAGFAYRYRVERGASQQEAQRDLHAIWKPSGAWKSFVSNVRPAINRHGREQGE